MMVIKESHMGRVAHRYDIAFLGSTSSTTEPPTAHEVHMHRDGALNVDCVPGRKSV